MQIWIDYSFIARYIHGHIDRYFFMNYYFNIIALMTVQMFGLYVQIIQSKYQNDQSCLLTNGNHEGVSSPKAVHAVYSIAKTLKKI